MGIRDEQKEARRREILFAAINLFVKKGYAATKISDIAAAVNMSNGLLFHYFPSKEKLYEEILKIGVMGPQMVMQFDQTEPLEFFKTVASGIMGAMKQEKMVAKIFILMMQAIMNESLPEEQRKLVNQIENIEQSVVLIELGQQNGTIKEGNPMALAVAFWGAIQGIAETLALYDFAMVPDAEWIVDIIKR